MLTVKQKSILSMIFGVAFVLTFIFPVKEIIENLYVGQSAKAVINFSVAFLTLGVFISWLLFFKKIYERKLQAIAVAEELGKKPITNFIVVRLLKALEYMLPFVILAFLMMGLNEVSSVPQAIFWNILAYQGAGLVVYIIHDYIRNYFLDANELEAALVTEMKVDALKTQYITKLNKK